MRNVTIFLLLLFSLIACQKNRPSIPDDKIVPPSSDEPVQTLAKETARKIRGMLESHGSTSIEFQQLQSRDIFSPDAFRYFENALAAQLATAGIQRAPGDWSLEGVLSKEEGHVVFSFKIWRIGDLIAFDSARIPDDARLQQTLAQFRPPADAQHDHHASHKEMPVPTPLVELTEIPLDVAENCSKDGPCSLLLLFPTKIVQRNWQDGTEQQIRLEISAERSRAPSGKILKVGDTFFIIGNQLGVPLAFDRNMQRLHPTLPARFPQAERGLNTFILSDGHFFDFEEFGPKGLAVIEIKNRLAVADQGKLASSDHPVGGALEVSPPYIYASSPTFSGEYRDAVQKFSYSDGLLRLEGSQNIDASVYDITITDLNRDQIKEMLLTVVNARGIFIEVREPF